MLHTTEDFMNFIDHLLQPVGFVKKKDTWYFRTNECLCFISIGKSPYGNYYDHVMGGFLEEINNTKNKFPPYYKADLKYSLGKMADKNTVKRAFDLDDNSFQANEREFLIEKLIKEYAVPFIQDISSKQGMRTALSKYDGLINMTKSDLKNHLKRPE